MDKIKIWTNTEFDGYFPVGTAAVVIAEDAASAADMLNFILRNSGLEGDAETKDMVEFDLVIGNVSILCDGNY